MTDVKVFSVLKSGLWCFFSVVTSSMKLNDSSLLDWLVNCLKSKFRGLQGLQLM